jgi:hypothetical protein
MSPSGNKGSPPGLYGSWVELTVELVATCILKPACLSRKAKLSLTAVIYIGIGNY